MADVQEEEKKEKDDSRGRPGPSEGWTASGVPDSGGPVADARTGPAQGPSSVDIPMEKGTKEPERDSKGIESNSRESPGKSQEPLGKSQETPGKSKESPGNSRESGRVEGNAQEPPGTKENDRDSAPKAPKRQGRSERVPRDAVPRTAEERVQLAKKMMALRQKEKLQELENSDRKSTDFLQRLEKEKAQRLSEKKKRDRDRKRDIEDRIRKLTDEENERKQQLLEKSASDTFSNQSTESSKGPGPHRRRALSLFSGKEPNYTTPTVAYQIRTTRPCSHNDDAPAVHCSRYRSVSPERYRSKSADYRPRKRQQPRSKSTDRPSRTVGPPPESRPRRSKTSTPPRQRKPTTAKTKKTGNNYGLSLSSSSTTTTASNSSLRRDATPSRQTQKKIEALAERSKPQEQKSNGPLEKAGDKRKDVKGTSMRLPLITLEGPTPTQVTEVKQPKQVKPLKEVKSPKEVRPPKELQQPTEAKTQKEVKPPKEVKSAKEVRPIKEAKPPKEVKPPKDVKPTKEVKPPKEAKTPKEVKPPKEVKEAKGQAGVNDETCSDDYKTKMLEMRRLAREKAKLQAEEDLAKINKTREEEAEKEREDKAKREREKQERMESDKKRAEDAQKEEEDRRKREEEEARIKEEEMKEKMDQEAKERELAEAKAKEEMKIKEKERIEKSKKEEEERMARKTKLNLIMKRVKTKDETKTDAGQALRPDAATGDSGPESPMPAAKEDDSQVITDKEIQPASEAHATLATVTNDNAIDDITDTGNADKGDIDKDNVISEPSLPSASDKKPDKEENVSWLQKLNQMMRRGKPKDETKPDAGQALKPDAGTEDVRPESQMPDAKEDNSQIASSSSEANSSLVAASVEAVTDKDIQPSSEAHTTLATVSKDNAIEDITDRDNADKGNADKDSTDKGDTDKGKTGVDDTYEKKIDTDITVQDNTDKDNTDKDNTYKDNTDKKHTNKDNNDKENTDKDNNDKVNTDKDNTYKDNTDKEHTNKDNNDKENTDKDRNDKVNTNKDNSDKDTTDKENTYKDSTYKDNTDKHNFPASQVDSSLQPASSDAIKSSEPSVSSTSDKKNDKDDNMTSDKKLSSEAHSSDKGENSDTEAESMSYGKADKIATSETGLSVAPATKDTTDKNRKPLDQALSSLSAVASDKDVDAASTDGSSLATVTKDNSSKTVTSIHTDDSSLATVTNDIANKMIVSFSTDDSSQASVTNDNKPVESSSWPLADEFGDLKSGSERGRGQVKAEVKEVRNLLIDLGESTEEPKLKTESHDDVKKASLSHPVVMNQSSFNDDDSDASSPADVVTPKHAMTPEGVTVSSHFTSSAAVSSSVKSSEASFAEGEFFSKDSWPDASIAEAKWSEDNLSHAWTSGMTASDVTPSSVTSSAVMTSTGVISTDANAWPTDLLSWSAPSPSVMTTSSDVMTTSSDVITTSTAVTATSQPRPTDVTLSDAVTPLATSSVPYNGLIDDATKDDVTVTSAREFSISKSLRK